MPQRDFNIPLADREYLSDLSRAAFLSDLDDADHIDLTDFEDEFIGSNLSREEFTDRQRAVIDSMRKKYGSRI